MAVPIFWLTCAACSLAVLMASVSLLSRAFFTSASASRTSDLMSSGTLSSFSPRNFSVWYTSVSAWLRTSASSRRRRSSSAYCSASRTIFSMSSLFSAEPPVICTDCCLPVPRSLADTLTMPLASMSKATSICGMPRGDGAMPVRSNMPSFLLYAAISRSPWYTWICTDGWLSSAVVKISDFLVWVDALVGLLAAGQRLHQVDDRGHPGGAANEYHVVDVGHLGVGVLDDLQERVLAAVEQVGGHALELGPGESGVQVQGAVRAVRDVGQVDLLLHRLRQLDLGLLGRLAQPLERHLVLGQVDAVAGLEFLYQTVA